MKILARGEKILIDELKQKISLVDCEITAIQDTDLLSIPIEQFDLIFDLSFDDHPETIKYYAPHKNKIIIVSAVKSQLALAESLYGRKIECVLVGMNALPGFINRSFAEVSLLNNENLSTVDEVFSKLGWQYKVVEDRVGMVTPRIIFMIINEACYTLQEGTATMQDIDTSMKLGTNYPFGPFEWADKIGIEHVYRTLTAIYDDTKDERYKICPLLKTLYLKNGSFYK